MKRFHVHVAVADLEQAIRFYATLFATGPTVRKADYAKWVLEDPRVNFAISRNGRSPGLDHLGIQVESAEELDAVQDRLADAAAPIFDQGDVTCCYTRSRKSWSSDPAGISWETFFSYGEAAIYGDGRERDQAPGAANLTISAESNRCCGPSAAG